MPTDAEIVLHVFICFFDMILPPLFAGSPPTTTTTATAHFGAGSSNLFGGYRTSASSGLCGCTLGGSSVSGPITDLAKTGVFWRTQKESCAFSLHYVANARDKHLHRSDVVILIHSAQKKRCESSRPRYSLLCDGVEWLVSPGEHNIWECLVLFIFQRAKQGGFLEGINLTAELYTAFMTAMSPESLTGIPEVSNAVVYHSLLSVLHPWSSQLQDVDLSEVSKQL